MASRDAAKFVSRVYEDDYREIQKLVQLYPRIETGGDLFGLWQDAQTVVIQLFIGPGKKCRRTTTSFHQDIEYLSRVGSLITSKEGLCHVGDWHSHHQIGMPRPSAADERTVFSDLPLHGLKRFVLFIASIESGKSKKRPLDVKLDQIVLNCFLFLQSTHEVIEGEIEIIQSKNPHRLHNRAKKEISDGAEVRPKENMPLKAPKSSDDKQREWRVKGVSAPEMRENPKTLQQLSDEWADWSVQRNVVDKPARQAQSGPSPAKTPGSTKPSQTSQSSREGERFPNGKNDRDDQLRKRQGREEELYPAQSRGKVNIKNVPRNTCSAQPSGSYTYESHPSSSRIRKDFGAPISQQRPASAQGGGRSNSSPSSQITQGQLLSLWSDGQERQQTFHQTPADTNQARAKPTWTTIGKIAGQGNF